MMPPICAICGVRFEPPTGGLIGFQLTEEQKKFNERFKQPGFTGHPAGQHWFCQEHLEGAQMLAHFHDVEALALLRIRYDSIPATAMDTAALLQLVQNCQQLTIESNKEVISYIRYSEQTYFFTIIDQLNTANRQIVELREEEVLDSLRKKLDAVSLQIGKFTMNNDHQRLSYVQLYPFWIN
jgi:hypothetical protein